MRQTRALVGVVLVVVVGVVVGVMVQAGAGPQGGAAGHAGRAQGSRTVSAALPAVEAGLLPWQLSAPVSREVALPGPGTSLTLLGGLSGTTSAAGVFTLDTTSGALQAVGVLPNAVHDAAGAVVGGQDVVFGGGSPTTVATVQTFPAPGAAATAGTGAPAAGSSGSTGTALPAPRSDAAAVTVGGTVYIVGGYDGSVADPTVLSTTDGHRFAAAGTLPVPVRYPAVAAVGHVVYVFGGQALRGPDAGSPVDVVQALDTVRHRASIVGHLPEPLEGAMAATLDGHIYLAGGESTEAQTNSPGMGATQIAPPSASSSRGAGASGAITDSVVRPTPSGSPPPAGKLTAAGGPTHTVSTVWAFDPVSRDLRVAGRLQVPVSHAAVAVLGSRAWIVGGESGGAQLAVVQMLEPSSAFGTAGAPGAGSPYFGGKLLVADRGNNRLLLMDPSLHVDWTYPSASSPPNPSGFFFPDDAFFIDKGKAIITNQEENETIEEIAYPSGKLLWSYGHPRTPGTGVGYLHEPDDAYLLRNGEISVADAQNCRVLILNTNGTVAHQIGTTGVCLHNPPQSVGSPNGDTPLADGNLLISEINGSWVSEYTPEGTLVWTVHLPITYPSDPQQIGPDRYLIADYASPGQILEFDRAGHILYRYDVAGGQGTLNHPSLVELLPSGVLMATDDYRNRVVAIDPATGALVWQYGINDVAGTGPGMLNTPDGFDLVMPDGSTPTHPVTG